MEKEQNNNNMPISNKLNKYIDLVIGKINCGNDSMCENDYIIQLENARTLRSREVIINLLNNIPPEDLIYIYHKEIRGITAVEDLDSLDIELLINYAALGVFNIIKSKNLCCLNHYKDKITLDENPSVVKKIVNKAEYYDKEISKLIDNKKNYIDKLLLTREPTFKFIGEHDFNSYTKTL